MPPVGFEPTISAGELPQTYALDRATTGTDNFETLVPFKTAPPVTGFDDPTAAATAEDVV